jgi:hypothetical protein
VDRNVTEEVRNILYLVICYFVALRQVRNLAQFIIIELRTCYPRDNSC